MNKSTHLLVAVAAVVAAPGVARAQTPGPTHDQAAPAAAQDHKSHRPDGDGACMCCCCRAMMQRHAPAAPSTTPHQQHPPGQDRTDSQGE